MPNTLIDQENSDPSLRKFKQQITQTNLKLCIQNGKQDLDISDIGDNENFVSRLFNKGVISNQEDLVLLKENFNQIKTCLQERSANHHIASQLIDKCEVFVNNGQLSDYKHCLLDTSYGVWNIEL